MSEETEVSGVGKDGPNQKFLKIISRSIYTTGKNWRIGIEVCGPTNSSGDRENVIGELAISPFNSRYSVSFNSLDSVANPTWSVQLDAEGNVYGSENISPDAFSQGLEALIDPKSPPDRPQFRLQVIRASLTEGAFPLEDHGLLRGTLMNRDIHVRVVRTTFPPIVDSPKMVD